MRALDGLSFAVPEGTVFGLLGPNGAGKTTVVKIMTTLSRADSGRAEVAGFDVRRDATRVRRAIGVVAQRHGVDIALTGRENLRLQGRVFGMSGKALEERAHTLLDQLGLAEWLTQRQQCQDGPGAAGEQVLLVRLPLRLAQPADQTPCIVEQRRLVQ